MSLTSDLQTYVKSKLLQWEPERELIKDLAIDWLNPGTGPEDTAAATPPPAPYSAMTHAIGRLTYFHDLIATEIGKPNSKVYRWISPRTAAVGCEAVFESAVALWLAAGPNKDPTKLRPAVARIIDWQVQMLTATIEGR